MKIFFLLYTLLWNCAIPFLFLNPRLKSAFKERLGLEKYIEQNDLDENKERIVLYAASGGEAFLACTFIKKEEREIQKQRLQITKKRRIYFCFTWTKEGYDTIKNFAQQTEDAEIRVFYTPFDKPKKLYTIIKEINPIHCYILETEIWLSLIRACHLLSVPYSFINARMSDKTFSRLFHLKKILEKFPPKNVYGLTEDDNEKFRELFSSEQSQIRFKIKENLKFEKIKELITYSQYIKKTGELPEPCLLFASIREEEENILLPIIKRIRTQFPKICIIVCPKHVHRAKFWKERLQSSICVSESNISVHNLVFNFNAGNKTIIWDRFGELIELYLFADVVFVGGSLHEKLGGQNFLEPLAFGIIPIVGGNLSNFDWVFTKKPTIKAVGLLRVIRNSNDLERSLIRELDRTFIIQRTITKGIVLNKFIKWIKGGVNELTYYLF